MPIRRRPTSRTGPERIPRDQDTAWSRHRGTHARFAEWDKVNPDTVYDPELFRREILPRLGIVPLAEIMQAAGCCKASASDYRRGKRTPHVSTWKALGKCLADH